MLPSAQLSDQHKHKAQPIDIISIQSQVVYGHVGNSAAMPIFQTHGLRALNIPTVLFSNTPLYPTCHGGVIPDDWFEGYLNAMSERDMLPTCKAIVLGYLGSQSQAKILDRWLLEVRTHYPHIRIIIDPVMGDMGCGLYVFPELVEAYRNHLHQHAHVLTPNFFELGKLTQKAHIQHAEDCISTARSLLSDTTQWVVVTSANPDQQNEGEIEVMVVSKDKVKRMTHPRYSIRAQGTGDVFCASLCAHMLLGQDVFSATQSAMQEVVQIIMRTQKADDNELVIVPPALMR